MPEYINMNDVVKCVKKETNLNTENRIREKLLEIFDMLDISRNLLKGRNSSVNEVTDASEYIFPKESTQFLNSLVSAFSDEDVKEMRRGNFHNASVNTMKKMIAGFEDMFKKMGFSESVIKEQIVRMYSRTNLLFWEKREKVFNIIDDMKEDFEIENVDNNDSNVAIDDTQEFMETLKEDMARRSRFFEVCDNVNKNDQLVFMDMIYQDYQKLQNRHRAIYQILSDIRTEEITDAAQESVINMSTEEEEELIWQANCRITIQEELNKNKHYRHLLKEQEKILAKNDFIKNLQPQFKKICDELKQINDETQIGIYGEVVLHDDIENTNFTSIKTSKQALDEAIMDFEEQEKSYAEYSEKRSRITPEEWESTRNVINSILADKGMPLIHNKEYNQC
ncbi:MAG: hypothetical protein ACYDG2_16030 [Ruminiclostridium sp.]